MVVSIVKPAPAPDELYLVLVVTRTRSLRDLFSSSGARGIPGAQKARFCALFCCREKSKI